MFNLASMVRAAISHLFGRPRPHMGADGAGLRPKTIDLPTPAGLLHPLPTRHTAGRRWGCDLIRVGRRTVVHRTGKTTDITIYTHRPRGKVWAGHGVPGAARRRARRTLMAEVA